MNRNTLGLIVAGLITGAAMAMFIARPAQPPTSGSTTVVTGRALVGGPFTLTDQTGRSVTDKDFLGRNMLLFFGFTNCPDICPTGLQVLTAALDKLGPAGNDITPIFVSFDSARDTPQLLATYLKSFHPRLVGLTGSEEQIKAITKAYRVYYQKVADDKNPTHYTYDHSAIFYLMAKDGALLAPIAHTTDADKLAEQIARALPQR